MKREAIATYLRGCGFATAIDQDGATLTQKHLTHLFQLWWKEEFQEDLNNNEPGQEEGIEKWPGLCHFINGYQDFVFLISLGKATEEQNKSKPETARHLANFIKGKYHV